MRILILSQYYPPETGAAQSRLSNWAKHLLHAGHSVTVLTSFPNYPTGRVFPKYRRQILQRETRDGITILRCWMFVTKSRNFFLRLVNYFSFVITSFIAGLVAAGECDVVLVELPPLFLGVSGVALGALKRARLCINVSDLWPSSAVALGVLRNKSLIRWATYLEEYTYRRAEIITGQTAGIVDDIRGRFPGKTVAWIPNGVDVSPGCTKAFTEAEVDSIRERFGVKDKFAIVYAGLHGMAQGLNTILGAAEVLRHETQIVFVFIGDGPEKDALQSEVQRRSLPNIRFFPPHPPSQITDILPCFDAALVPLKEHVLFRGALPSKLFAAMRAGLPVILSIKGEAEALVQSANCGVCVPPEDAQMIASAVLRLNSNPELRNVLGHNGREYVKAHFDQEVIATRLEKLLSTETSLLQVSSIRAEGRYGTD